MQFDFDKIIERHGTDCLKFDFTAERHKPGDVRSYWVADMDFQTAPSVIEAIVKRARHGIFGYTDVSERYFKSVASWYARRFGFEARRESLTVTPGIVFAMACAIHAYTDPGDSVLIQNPVYYPFAHTIKAQGRKVVSSDLINKDDSGRYEIDFEDFERKVKQNNVKLFLLCSPHNPVGRVWTRDELERVLAVCAENNTVVFSDEIHSDFVFSPHRHTPFPSLSAQAEDICVWATAPTKSFNLAGLQVSNIFIANKALRRAFRRTLDEFGYSQPNTLGLAASEAAYTTGEQWFDELKSYISGNMDFAADFINRNGSPMRARKSEGTYLLWIDCRPLNLSVAALDDIIVNKAKLWLDSGKIFGTSGRGYQRINVACPRAYLEEGLSALCSQLSAVSSQ